MEFFQICVSKCPDRYLTFLKASSIDHTATQELKYYQQFCVPEFTNLKKVSGLDCWIVALFFLKVQVKNLLFWSEINFDAPRLSQSLFQSAPEVLKDGECPAMLTPSKPCKS